MFEFICFILGVVVARITSVYAGTVVGPSNIQELNDMIFECSKENHITDNELHIVMQLEDVSAINPCFWACCLKKAGFLDDNGHYILEAGLTYARNFVKKDDAYTILETIARMCDSVPRGTTKCEWGAMIVGCFAEQIDRIRFFSKR